MLPRPTHQHHIWGGRGGGCFGGLGWPVWDGWFGLAGLGCLLGGMQVTARGGIGAVDGAAGYGGNATGVVVAAAIRSQARGGVGRSRWR